MLCNVMHTEKKTLKMSKSKNKLELSSDKFQANLYQDKELVLFRVKASKIAQIAKISFKISFIIANVSFVFKYT